MPTPVQQVLVFPADESRPRIYSIGHSTRTLEELVGVLRHFRIELVADIRHFPASRHNPQFNKDLLEQELPRHCIQYCWIERLGGFRKTGYLAYMETEDFAAGIRELEAWARQGLTAFMCAELKWFQCHRRHVSDVLAAHGWRVMHIFTEKRADEHRLKFNKIKCD